MKCVAGDIVVDIRQQIFVGGDSESRRPIFPLNLKSATGVDISETVDRSFLSFRVTIAAHAGQMAVRNQTHAPSEDNDREPFHVESHSMITMRRQLALDSTKIQERIFLQSSAAAPLALFAETTAPEKLAARCNHGAIFIFTASTGTLST
jgi:hypothetical protein